ncbi:Arsenic resistance transcriptional regulator ArsR2 [Thalassocella blandensis]|nr:Arsenic resistance transcriptional regulator ArsR2 [Thalassocella blandensis]
MVFMNTSQFFKVLSDDTRLNATLLVMREGELCVCELMCALQLSQPKISRHLAQLRQHGVLVDRRKGQWVYYALSPNLPSWSIAVLEQAWSAQTSVMQEFQSLLSNMQDRPLCC